MFGTFGTCFAQAKVTASWGPDSFFIVYVQACRHTPVAWSDLEMKFVNPAVATDDNRTRPEMQENLFVASLRPMLNVGPSGPAGFGGRTTTKLP